MLNKLNPKNMLVFELYEMKVDFGESKNQKNE